MRNTLRKIFLVVFVLSAVSISAQQNYPFNFGVHAGLSIPSTPTVFQKNWLPAISLGIDGLKPIGGLFSIGTELNYASTTYDHGSPAIEGGTASFLTLTAYTKIMENNSSRIFLPFIRAGAGINISTITELTIRGNVLVKEEHNSGAALHFGGGFNYNIDYLRQFSIEVTYSINKMGSDKYSLILMNVGFRFNI